MKKLIIGVIAILALSVMPAAADTINAGQSLTYNYSQITSGGTLSATVVYTLTSSGHMTVTVTNTTSGAGGSVRPALTAVGFTSTPNLTPNVGSMTGTANVADWHLDNGTGLGNQWEIHAGDPGTCNQGAAPGTSINGALCAGATGTFSFTFSPNVGTVSFDSTVVKFQTTVGSFEPRGTPGQSTVPEPAGLALLGTGLISAGGFIRRKISK